MKKYLFLLLFSIFTNNHILAQVRGASTASYAAGQCQWRGQCPQQPDDAGISTIEFPVGNSCATTIKPTVVLKNYGAHILTSVTIQYEFDSGSPWMHFWTGNLNPGCTESILLPGVITSHGPHTFKSYTTFPNGVNEGYTHNDTSTSSFILNLLPAPGIPLFESFEGVVFPPQNWLKYPEVLGSWNQTSLASYTGGNSTIIRNYNNSSIGAVYDLDMPMINIATITNPVLEFNYAYAYYPGFFDSLQVMISNDCGVTWQNLFYKGGNALMTAPATTNLFYPVSGQWIHENISLAAYSGEVLIRFRNINGNGNNLFIDDININQSTGINDLTSTEQGIIIYPIPANDMITIEGMPVNSQLQISDLTGKILLSTNANTSTINLDLSALPAGIYFLITPGNKKKFVKL